MRKPAKTLHAIPLDRLCWQPLRFVADAAESRSYRKALQDWSAKCGDWSDVTIHVGVTGLAFQRVFICRSFPEAKHIVSLNDGVERLQFCKEVRGRHVICNSDGGLSTAFIFGPNCSTKEHFFSHPWRVSRCNGLVADC